MRNNVLKYRGSNYYYFVIIFLSFLVTMLIYVFLDLRNNCFNCIYNSLKLIFYLMVVLFILSFFFMNIIEIYEDKIVVFSMFRLRKNEIRYNNINRIIYSTPRHKYDTYKIVLINSNKMYSINITSRYKRKEIIDFFKNKGLNVIIDIDEKRNKEILKKKPPDFWYRNFPLLFGDKGLF